MAKTGVNKKTSSVLTNKELSKEKALTPSPASNKPAKTADVILKEKRDVEVKFECGFAPAGESTISFTHKYMDDEYKYNLKLNNKIYILPNDLSEADKKRYRAALRANGFMDITVIESGAVFNKKKGCMQYQLIHPEHSARNRINCNISLAMVDESGRPKSDKLGKQISKQISVIEGIVDTDDPDVYEALLKAGFLTAKISEKEK